MKLFSTKTHGMLDYLTAGTMLALPRMLGWSENVTRVLDIAALGTLGYSLLTDYELSAARVLPMKTHLLLDGMSGVLFTGAPALFPDEDASVTRTLMGLGLFEIVASLTTETSPSPAASSSHDIRPLDTFRYSKIG